MRKTIKKVNEVVGTKDGPGMLVGFINWLN